MRPRALSSILTALPFVLAPLFAVACAPGETPSELTPIGTIQGTGPSSLLEGSEVRVEGIVSAHFPALGGFFMESAVGEDDGDPDTSEGLFIVWEPPADTALATGQRVRVHGTVTERGESPPTLTALDEVESVELLGPPNPEALLPVTITDAPTGPITWDRLEGMLVRIEAPLTVTGHSGLQRFGEIIASFDGRLFQPTELNRPGPEADSLRAHNDRMKLVLDDGSNEQWPEAIAYLPDWPEHDTPLRIGSVLEPMTGVIDVRRAGHLLLPIEQIAVREAATRPDPPSADGRLRIGVINLENLFNGDGEGGGFPTPRGAQTFTLYERQQAKLVATLQALDVHVAALAEVENDGVGPRTAIAQFAEALNEAGPARDWAPVELEGPGGDAIRVGLLYRTGSVTPVGPAVFPTDSIFEWGSRPPLAQAFLPNGEGAGSGATATGGEGSTAEPWVIVANHLKSKAGCPDAGHPRAGPGDADQNDGQACWNAHRVVAAEALADWIDADPTGMGTQRALIVGDLNSYAQEDPISLLRERGWADAFAESDGGPPYSYVFQGESGRLDHVLIRTSQRPHLAGAAIWHSNADEFTGFGYEYDPEPTVWRSSDHDALVVGLDP